jgi:hypothetical protein
VKFSSGQSIDVLGSYHPDQFFSRCEKREINVLFLVLHASDSIQPLDAVTFAILRQRFPSSKFSRLHNLQSNQVVQVLGAWFATSARYHNVEAFLNVDLVPVEQDKVPAFESNASTRDVWEDGEQLRREYPRPTSAHVTTKNASPDTDGEKDCGPHALYLPGNPVTWAP